MPLSKPTSETDPLTQGQLLEQLDLSQPPAAILEQTLPVLGQQLQCDRVFIYLRAPRQHVGRVPFCWCRHDDIPLVYDPEWKPEPRWLLRQDPMFAAALRGKPSLFINDVEMADPKQVNRNFERQTFGHRALIHAHLYQKNRLWGILQPCIFDHSRQWTREDRLLIKGVVNWLTPVAAEYVNHDR